MEFQNFYQYAKNIKQKGFSLNLLSTNSHPTNHQATIDLLFKELEKSENQPEKFPVFLDRCQSLINHYSKITPIPSSIPITVLSLSAIKLEIYRRQNDHSNLNKEFCFLFWAISCSIKIDNNLLENVGSNLKSSVIQLIQELLPNLRHLPPRITRQKSQLSVPEVLADASYIAGNNYDLNKIRKIFYELWQV